MAELYRKLRLCGGEIWWSVRGRDGEEKRAGEVATLRDRRASRNGLGMGLEWARFVLRESGRVADPPLRTDAALAICLARMDFAEEDA